MFKIRNGCFETNSSSTHTIIVSDRDVDYDYKFTIFCIGEFGWEMGVIDDSWGRASYFYTAACELTGRDVKDDIIALLEPLGIQCVFNEDKAPFFKDYDGDDRKYLDNGYIDHCEELQEFVNDLMKDGKALARFIFNDESFVVTGNDNCDGIDREWMDGKEAKADSYPHTTYYKGN